MSILDNAVDAIQTGVEDYAQGSQSRMKSAVRNVHAGVLLLFKSKLQQLSPTDSDEVLLKQRVLPSHGSTGSIRFSGKGKKTVDVQTIKERFKSLGIHVDWPQFDAINRIRNEIEHYYTTANPATIREALSKSFAVASLFANQHLSIDLRDCLTDDSWDQLIEIQEFFEAESQLCIASHSLISSAFAQHHLRYHHCPDCSSSLIQVRDDKATAGCRACTKEWSIEELTLEVVQDAGGSDAFMAVKEGGEETVIDCPECCEFAFVVAEAKCVVCGAECSTTCHRCDAGIPACEIDGSGYCSWCNHMMSKDD